MADEKKSLTEPSHSNMTSAGVFRGSSAHLPRIFRGAGETDFLGLVATRWPPGGPPAGGHPVARHPVATRCPPQEKIDEKSIVSPGALRPLTAKSMIPLLGAHPVPSDP